MGGRCSRFFGHVALADHIDCARRVEITPIPGRPTRPAVRPGFKNDIGLLQSVGPRLLPRARGPFRYPFDACRWTLRFAAARMSTYSSNGGFDPGYQRFT